MYSVLHTLSRFMTTPVLLEQIERVQKKIPLMVLYLHDQGGSATFVENLRPRHVKI